MKDDDDSFKKQVSAAETRAAAAEAKMTDMQRLLKLALARITALEERLNKNSRNSSKPSSTDQKANAKDDDSKPKRKNREKGFQRKPFSEDKVDSFITPSLDLCPCCDSRQLHDLEGSLILQQVDLPEIKALVTQFSLKKYQCKSCGEASCADLTKGIPNSSFGPRLMGLIVDLTGPLQMSKRDAIQLVNDLYDIKISEGSIINIEERVSAAMDEPYERIHNHVMQSILAKHFDETSWRDKGKGHYVWVGSTAKASYFHINRRRSRKAFDAFVGTFGLSSAPVVTDRYGVYEPLEQPHQYCLAHLIRDFHKYAERKGTDGEIGKSIEQELRQICGNHRVFCRDEISSRELMSSLILPITIQTF
jgi:transposase